MFEKSQRHLCAQCERNLSRPYQQGKLCTKSSGAVKARYGYWKRRIIQIGSGSRLNEVVLSGKRCCYQDDLFNILRLLNYPEFWARIIRYIRLLHLPLSLVSCERNVRINNLPVQPNTTSDREAQVVTKLWMYEPDKQGIFAEKMPCLHTSYPREPGCP